MIDFLVEQVRLAGAQMEAEVPSKARAVLSEAGRRIAVIAPIATTAAAPDRSRPAIGVTSIRSVPGKGVLA